tara:strand:+ start:31 stop:453 length:423 start_codon:yes stop_codon:yes gene_type:complete
MDYAGFWKRVGASIIDTLLTGLFGFLLGAVLAFMSIGMQWSQETTMMLARVLQVLCIIFTWLYYTILESSKLQATIGKMALGIVVTDLAGNRISFGRANGRYFSKLLSAIPFGFGFIMAGTTAQKQGLHDKIANCLVMSR